MKWTSNIKNCMLAGLLGLSIGTMYNAMQSKWLYQNQWLDDHKLDRNIAQKSFLIVNQLRVIKSNHVLNV